MYRNRNRGIAFDTKIITISREFGSGGRSIGKAIAKQLDIPYYDKELVKQVALETKFDEKYIEDAGEYSPGATSLSYWLPFTGSDGFMGGLSPASFLWVVQRKVILDIAEKGPCVIVGRCADFILRDRDDCFHVFVHADMDFKADRIVRLYGQTEKTPEERLSEKDKKRSINYIKDPQDKHALLVDPEAAEIVKSIFSMFLSGKNKRGITLYLNDHGVPCPTAYKQSQGLKYNAPNAQGNPMWSTITIDTILKNRVYVGDMVQGRQRVKSYKIHIQERVPEEEWFIVENTHEAIIDRETFDKVQGLLKRDTRTAPKQKQLYLFSGFLKCADCGRAMSRIASKGVYVYYQCGTYKSQSKTACTMHPIKNTRLEVGVLFAIQQQVHLAVTYSELVSRINAAPLKKSKSNRLEDMIAVKEKELSKIMRYKQALYQDWKDGEITHNDYRHMSEDYEQQAESINTILRTLREERDQLENGMDAESPFLTAFLKYQNIEKLTRDILIELIDHIKVYEGGKISVKFKYADEFRRMAEYIELNSQLAG